MRRTALPFTNPFHKNYPVENKTYDADRAFNWNTCLDRTVLDNMLTNSEF